MPPLLTFALGIAGMGKVQQQFFPTQAALKFWWLWLPKAAVLP